MNLKALRTTALLALLTVLFYWKILLTKQFTLLSQWEGVNQGYAWLQFTLRSLRHSKLPLWDPYTFSGHSFVGEMQTSGLSPFNLLLSLGPMSGFHGLLPVDIYNLYFVGLHFLGVVFAYALARELKIGRLGAIVAGMCFSLGGLLGRVSDWPDLIQSGIWLPLMMLFLIRALRSGAFLSQVFYAALSGVTIGMSILGGRLHMVIMQVMVTVTAAAFFAWQGELEDESLPENRRTTDPAGRFRRAGVLVAIAGAAAFGAGALQLFPSYSYASKSLRFLGEQSSRGDTLIPYAYLRDHFALPESIVSFLFPNGFNGGGGQGEFMLPYIGVLSFFMAIYAMVTRWRNPWVRYFSFLALAATLYSFGPFSALHGMLYVMVPKLWMLRQAGRIVYLSSFALSMLAGFGIDRLFAKSDETNGDKSRSIQVFERALLVVVFASAAVLIVGGAFNLPVNAWVQLSFVLIFLAYGVCRAAAKGAIGPFAQGFAVFVILFDLSAFNWVPRDKIEVAKQDELMRLVTCENAAGFLKAQPGPFRVDLPGPNPPNIGDAFAVLSNRGASATLLTNYIEIMGRQDLLDVQYVMKPASANDPNPVFEDPYWKIFRTGNRYQHAWLVHKTVQLPVAGRFAQVNNLNFDFHQIATTVEPLDGQLDAPAAEPSGEAAWFTEYKPARLHLSVESKGRGLLVLSEIYDSDWTAKVNGQSVPIHEVDGALRGIVVPNGHSNVRLDYNPVSVLAGGILTILTFLGMGALALFHRKSLKQENATGLIADHEAIQKA